MDVGHRPYIRPNIAARSQAHGEGRLCLLVGDALTPRCSLRHRRTPRRIRAPPLCRGQSWPALDTIRPYTDWGRPNLAHSALILSVDTGAAIQMAGVRIAVTSYRGAHRYNPRALLN